MDKVEMIRLKVSEGWDQPLVVVVDNKTIQAEEIAMLGGLLSPEERKKSGRFRFDLDRESYTIVHGLLRRILGDYFNIPPSVVEIGYDNMGKPSVKSGRGKMFFNLSHSAGVSVLAFDRDHEIGVDVEQIVSDFEYLPVVDRFFNGEEKKNLLTPKSGGIMEFYRIWTRKEALLKAIGTGIGTDLAISVTGPVSSGFQLNTVQWSEQYFITVATYPASGRITDFIS